MRYDICKASAPKMPNLGKGAECIKLLLSQASKDMHEPLVPMLFPSLGAHISGAEFQYPDSSWKEMCGLMANLVAESGDNKGQLSYLAEASHGTRLSAQSGTPKQPTRHSLFFFVLFCTRYGNGMKNFCYLCNRFEKSYWRTIVLT